MYIKSFIPVLKSLIYPSRKVFLLALIISLLTVFQYVLWYLLPPDGMVFTGTYNEAESGNIAGIRSVSEGFVNYFSLPGEPTSKYFFSDIIGYGPIYLDIVLGIISILLLKQIMLTYVLAKALFTFLLVVSSFKLFGVLTKDEKEQKLSFYLYVFSVGFGGLIYFVRFALLGAPIIPDTFFGFGVGLLRVAGFYLVIPLVFSFLGLAAAIKNRIYFSIILVGIATVFYPTHGLISFLLVCLYLFLHDKKMMILKILPIMILFSSVWLIPYFMNSYDFNNYIQLNRQNSVIFLPSVALGFGPVLLLALIHFNPLKTRRCKLIFLAALISSILTSIAFFKDIGVLGYTSIPYSIISFAKDNSIVLQVPFVLSMLICAGLIYTKRSKSNMDSTFLLLWLFLSLVIIFSPREITNLFPDKMLYFVYIPAMIFAAKGLVYFSEKHKISAGNIMTIIILVAVPGIFFTFSYQQLQPRINPELSESAFYTNDEYNALKFLEGQEMGIVIAPQKIAINVPFLSGKSVLSIEPNFANFTYDSNVKMVDQKKFFDSSDSEKLVIIEKYGLNYAVSYGNIFENSTLMKRIFQSGNVNLYKINY